MKIKVEELKKGDIIRPFKNSSEEPNASDKKITLLSDPKKTNGVFADIFVMFDTEKYIVNDLIDGENFETEIMLRIGEEIIKIN